MAIRMQAAVFTTEGLPAAERFGVWREENTRSIIPSYVRTDRVNEFQGMLTTLDLGIIQVNLVRYSSIEARRTAKLIRRSDPEKYQLAVVLDGTHGIEQAGRQSLLRPGHAMIYDSSQPFDAFAVHEGTAELMVAHFPKSLLPLPAAEIDKLLALPLDTSEGTASLAVGCLSRLVTRPDTFRAVDGPRLANVALDLVTVMLSEQLGRPTESANESHRRTLLLRIQNFIENNLADPELTPAMIARSNLISVSYLHRLYREQGQSVAVWTRSRRLERCRRDLADPALAGTPVHAIGRRWGFVRAADFSRVFRTAYGMPPGEFRRLMSEGAVSPAAATDCR